MASERQPVRVFISYSHEDLDHRDELVKHMALLRRQGLIDLWDDRRIVPTEEWEPAIEAHLNSSDLIFLLISAEFIDSDYCYNKEMPRAMERQRAGEARVLPVFLCHCDWEEAPFAKLEGLPRGAVPITEHPDRHKAWKGVAQGVREVIATLRTTPRKLPAPSGLAIHRTDELRVYGEAVFAGRKAELRLLDKALTEGKARILSLWAEGGAGKTRLLFEWLRKVGDDAWRGLTRVFVHSFYSQGSGDDRGGSSDHFFGDALEFFGYAGEPITSPDEKGRLLAEMVVESNALLVLDGLEPLQYPPYDARRGELKDPGVKALLAAMANAAAGLCLVTTRQKLPELERRRGKVVK